MTSLPLCVRTQLCILFWQSMQTSLPLCVRTQLCILFQQQADVIAIVCPYPNMYTIVVAGRRHYHCVFVTNSVYCPSSKANVITNVSVPNSECCSSSMHTPLPLCVGTQLCILFQQQADVITNVCSYPILYSVLVAGRRHYQCVFVPNSVYCSSSRQTSLPMCVRTQFCIQFQEQADVITNVCSYPTLYTVLVAGRGHHYCVSVPNSVCCSSSMHTSLPLCVRIQLCILFQQQADVTTNVCSYPTLYTVLVAGRRHYQYMSVPNSAYYSSSRQTSLPMYVRAQLCIQFQQQADVITNICSYPTLYTVLVAGRRHYHCVSVPNSVYCSSSKANVITNMCPYLTECCSSSMHTPLPLCAGTQLCILFQQQADVITNVCLYPILYTVLVAGRRHYQCVFVPNSVYCSSSRQTSIPMCVRTQFCILFQQQADVITNVCSYPTLCTVLVAGRGHHYCVSVPNSVYCFSSRQTSLPMCVRTQLCMLFQQHAYVITIVCPYPTLYTVLVAGRRHYQCVLVPTLYTVLVAGRRHYQYMFVTNSVYCSSSRQTSLPIYVRTQLCILFQQQADVITNICSYPTLYTILVAGRRHYQYMFVSNSAYCSSSRQTSLPTYVRIQLCILFQQQADVITNICPYPTLHTVLVAGRRHYQYMSVPNSVYYSSSRQTSLPIYVRIQLCILFQQQADVITNICSYPTLYTVLVAGRRHYQYMFVSNSVCYSSSRQTSLPIYVRTQLCILFQQQADVITNICSYPTLYTVLVAGRRHYQYMFESNSVYYSSSRQTSLPIYVRTQLCIMFQQQADVITNICSYPTLHTVLVAGRRHYQYMFVSNSVYCSSSRQTSLPIYVRIQICILFQQQADVITNICPYATLYTVLVADRRHYHCVFVANTVCCSSSRQTSLTMCVRTQLCILFQQQADVITIVCPYPTLYTVLVAGRRHYHCVSYPTLYYVLVAGRRHYHCVSVSNSVYCFSSRQTSLPLCVRTQICILLWQQADVITIVCP